jgi:hypothetical protein
MDEQPTQVEESSVESTVKRAASVPDGLTMVAVAGLEADDRAGQHRQGVEAFRGALIADPQPPEAAKPGPGALDRPAVAAKPL